ncbi:MAG TPA: hypothetical protein VJN88_16340, partial [Ktedonobacterales bacterium]|nr:hypothetical protein [Ktedonobacterales bacterium]
MATPEAPNLPACPLAIAERTLSALRDEALSPAEAAHLAAHAETCPTCRARLAAFADLAAVLRSERPPEPDERLWRTFAASTPMTHSRSRFHLPGVTLSRQSWNKLGALAAVLLLTLGFLTMSNLQRAGISVRTTPTMTLAPAGTSTPMPTATPDLRPAHPLTWQPAITSAPGEVTAVADDGESAYACSVTASVAVTGLINIWRTPDRGASWLPAQSVPSTPTANGCELVVDASDPSVAALAWAPRGGGAGDSFTGLMTTVDGGMTWQAQPQQPFTRIDQLDSRGGVIYALRETAPGSAVESHLWASSDRMQTWRQVDPGQTLSSAVAGFWLQPDGPGILAVVSVGGGGIQAQLYYSPNNGVTWNHLNVPGGLPLNYTPARFFSPFGLPNGIVARSIQGRFHICVSLSAPNAP